MARMTDGDKTPWPGLSKDPKDWTFDVKAWDIECIEIFVCPKMYPEYDSVTCEALDHVMVPAGFEEMSECSWECSEFTEGTSENVATIIETMKGLGFEHEPGMLK